MNKRILQSLKILKRDLYRMFHRLDIKVLPVFAVNGLLASFYYTFISRAFYREHLAVLRGRLAYQKSLSNTSQSSVLLRRNVHRLEKGLIMQPRKPVFATAYIGETVECYLTCLEHGKVAAGEMSWANDVIAEYFKVVSSSDQEVASHKARFEAAPSLLKTGQCKPYPQRELPSAPMSFEDLHILFKRRRSVRWYSKQRVDSNLIERAVAAAAQAPSACNRQPYRFIYFDEPDQVKQVAGLAMGTSGFYQQLPSVFAVVGDLSCYPKERDRHVIYIDASLASMLLMLGLETQGVSTCPINWPDIEKRERKLEKKLGLNKHERVVMLIAAGYADPAGGVPYSQKKSADSLLRMQASNRSGAAAMVE